MPAAVLIPLITAAAGAGATVAAAKMSSNASRDAANMAVQGSNHAADVAGKGNADALAFQKEESARNLAMADSTQHANYNQWAAREGRISSIGQQLGLSPRDIPAYVPLTPAAGTSGGAAPSGASAGSQTMPAGIDPRFAALYQQAGVTPGPRGSGPADWQYYQHDAVANAKGDVNYVLGRLANDLKGGPGTSTTSSVRAMLPQPYQSSPMAATAPQDPLTPALPYPSYRSRLGAML